MADAFRLNREMALPVLGASFCFRDLDEPTRNEFLAHFDLYTRRGGG